MKNARLSWTLPTTRTSGFPLDPFDINVVNLFMSADAGANWVSVADVPSTTLEFLISDLDIGTYQFKAVVEDSDGLRSADSNVEIGLVPDETAPSAISDLMVTIE